MTRLMSAYGPKRTSQLRRGMSAIGGKAHMAAANALAICS